MSRKDYVLIAEALRFADVDAATKLVVAEALASALKSDNGSFDRARFVAAVTK